MSKAVFSKTSSTDVVLEDAFWEADSGWDEYFLNQSVWVHMDEYSPHLVGDEDYSRIIIHSSNDSGWKYSRRLKDRDLVHAVFAAIKKPVSEKNLVELGFEKWCGADA